MRGEDDLFSGALSSPPNASISPFPARSSNKKRNMCAIKWWSQTDPFMDDAATIVRADAAEAHRNKEGPDRRMESDLETLLRCAIWAQREPETFSMM
jgi:hypothetical protein